MFLCKQRSNLFLRQSASYLTLRDQVMLLFKESSIANECIKDMHYSVTRHKEREIKNHP